MDRTTRFCSRLFQLGVVLLVCQGLLGCGSSAAAKTAKVTGKVTDSGGAPIKGATVSFAGTEGKAFSASGTTGDDGTYSLSTFDTNDGAPPGQYSVTVTDASGAVRPISGSASATVAEGKANTIDLKVEGTGSGAAPPATPATPE